MKKEPWTAPAVYELTCSPDGWVAYDKPNELGGIDSIMLGHVSWCRRWQKLFGRKK